MTGLKLTVISEGGYVGNKTITYGRGNDHSDGGDTFEDMITVNNTTIKILLKKFNLRFLYLVTTIFPRIKQQVESTKIKCDTVKLLFWWNFHCNTLFKPVLSPKLGLYCFYAHV